MKVIIFGILFLVVLFPPLVCQATVTYYDFEDGTIQDWVNDTTVNFADNLGTPSNSMNQAQGGTHSLSYPLNLDVKEPAYNCINDAGLVTFSTPKDLSNAVGISLYVYLPATADIDPATPAVASVYVKTGPEWKWFESNDYTDITLGNWIKININFSLAKDSSDNRNQPVTDLNEIHEIGVHISGANVSSGQTALYVDTVEFQGSFSMTNVTVEVEGVINAIRLSGSINFSLVPLGGEVVSNNPLTIENIGTAPVTLSLSLVDPPAWTSVRSTPGYNTYVLNAMFNEEKPPHANFNETQHVVVVAPRKSTSVIFAGNQIGMSILPGEIRTLWLEFRAPLLTEAATEQTIKMIISAEITGETGLGISIDTRSYNFGVLTENVSAVSTMPIGIANTGSVPETYWLQLVEPQDWIHSTEAPGDNIYVLNAAFDSDGVIIWNIINHALDTILTSSNMTKFAGDQCGANVPMGEKINLWLQIKTPTQISKISSSHPQNIRILLVASQF